MKAFSHSYYRLKSPPGLALEEEIVCLNYLVVLIKIVSLFLSALFTENTSHSSINNDGIIIKRWALRSFKRKYPMGVGIYIWEWEFSLTCQHDLAIWADSISHLSRGLESLNIVIEVIYL